MANRKTTSPRVATLASRQLQDGRTSERTRAVAASALAQAGQGKKPKK